MNQQCHEIANAKRQWPETLLKGVKYPDWDVYGNVSTCPPSLGPHTPFLAPLLSLLFLYVHLLLPVFLYHFFPVTLEEDSTLLSAVRGEQRLAGEGWKWGPLSGSPGNGGCWVQGEHWLRSKESCFETYQSHTFKPGLCSSAENKNEWMESLREEHSWIKN